MAARNTRRRDSSGHIDPYFQRRARYEAVLGPLGLWELFARMPKGAQNGFCQCKFPDPILEFDQTFPTDGEHRALRKSLEAAFRKVSIIIDGVEVSVRDFFAVIGGLRFTIRDAIRQPGLPQECVQFMHEAAPCLERWYEPNLTDVWDSLYTAMIVPLVAHSRMDTRLLKAAVQRDEAANGKFVVRMTVGAIEPQMQRVNLDGGSRPMYRVCTTHEWADVRWLSWHPEQMEAINTPRLQGERPVYVQSHALRQLRERVNLTKMAAYLEHWLYDSLAKPNIIEECGGGDFLVEYRIQNYRLGYLIVTPLRDLVAVRTFLFLTMERTPEARMLKAKLRLTRQDVDWLGLHELEAFTQTDLKNDPVLRPLMEACGCGHLFALAEDFNADFAPQPKAFAAEMRKYLRMAA